MTKKDLFFTNVILPAITLVILLLRMSPGLPRLADVHRCGAKEDDAISWLEKKHKKGSIGDLDTAKTIQVK